MKKITSRKQRSRRRSLVALIVLAELVVFASIAIASGYLLFYAGLAVSDETHQKSIEKQVESQGFTTYEQRDEIDSYDKGRKDTAARNDIYKWAYLSNTSHTGVFVRAIVLAVDFALFICSLFLSALCIKKLSKLAIRWLVSKAKLIIQYMKSFWIWIRNTVLPWTKAKCKAIRKFAKAKVFVNVEVIK